MQVQVLLGDTATVQSERKWPPAWAKIRSVGAFVLFAGMAVSLPGLATAAVTKREYWQLAQGALNGISTQFLYRTYHFIAYKILHRAHAITFETTPPRVVLRSRFCRSLDRTIFCSRIRCFVPCARVVWKDILLSNVLEIQNGIEAVSLGEPICFAWGLGINEAVELTIKLNQHLGVREPEGELAELFCSSQDTHFPLTYQAELPSTFPYDSVLQVTHHTFHVLRVSKQSRYRFSMFHSLYEPIFWAMYLIFFALLAVVLAPEQRVALIDLYYDYYFGRGLSLLLIFIVARIILALNRNRPYGELLWTFSASELHEAEVRSGVERSWDIRHAKYIYIHRTAVPSFIEMQTWVADFCLHQSNLRTASGRRFAISVRRIDDSELCRLPSTNDLTEGEATRLASLMRERYPRLCRNEFAV